MSSDDGLSEYHNKVQHHLQLSPKKPNCHHQQLSIHHEPTSSSSSSGVSSIASASTQTINCCEITGTINGGTIKRRKSASLSTASPVAYSIHHSLQQSHDDTCDNIHGDDTAMVVVQPTKSNSNSIGSTFNYNGTNGSGNGIITNNNIMSPSKYIHHNDGVYLHMASGGNNCLTGSSRLSIHHPTANDRYDAEITTCCLPPPSPAPSSDRFVNVLGIPSPSMPGHHHHHQQMYQQSTAENKFSTIHHRSISPSSR